MAQKTLKTSLERLRKELAEPTNLDADTRRELAEVADTIERVLEEPQPDYARAHARIEDAALSFEARHPAFARILSEVTDALAKLGL
jgi:hypothetical protein